LLQDFSPFLPLFSESLFDGGLVAAGILKAAWGRIMEGRRPGDDHPKRPADNENADR
jgi:hypothetical protein